MKALKCGVLYDPASGQSRKNAVILVDGQKIADVVERVPEGAETVDLSQKFVMPGFIDAHVHVDSDAGTASYDMSVYRTAGDLAYAALPRAQAMLRAGFTTLRNAGSHYYTDVALKNAVNAGLFPGPNILASGEAIGATGGHGDSHWNPYMKNAMAAPVIADSPDECRKAVRYNLKHGADFIKVLATGGVMSRGTTIGEQQMSFDELRAVAETCELYGVRSAAHCHGTTGIRDAARAGITSIEHATMLDDECIDIMVKMGTFIVPTFIAPEMIIVNGEAAGIPGWMAEKARQCAINHASGVRRAFLAGVPVAFGSDVGTPFNVHGKQAREFELMVRAGFTPAEALRAATDTGARLLGLRDRVGAVEKGMLADIIAFDRSPLEDISETSRCAFVMSRGQTV